MKGLSFDVLKSCLDGLERALLYLEEAAKDKIDTELFRDASIKKFEMTIEHVGKLLRKLIPEYTGNKTATAKMTYNELLRYGGQFGLIDDVERWIHYREARNTTTHEYGENFSKSTIPMLHAFLKDGRLLLQRFEEKHG